MMTVYQTILSHSCDDTKYHIVELIQALNPKSHDFRVILNKKKRIYIAKCAE